MWHMRRGPAWSIELSKQIIIIKCVRRARTDVLAHHESVVGVVYRRGVPHEDAPLSSSRRQSNSGLRSPSPDSRLQVAEDDDDDDDDGDVVLCRWIFKGGGRRSWWFLLLCSCCSWYCCSCCCYWCCCFCSCCSARRQRVAGNVYFG